MSEQERAALRAVVRGRVQGVGFRDYVERRARGLHLSGFVRNLSDGRAVEVVAEGPRADLERLLGHLHEGPGGSYVIEVETRWSEPTGAYTDFSTTY